MRAIAAAMLGANHLEATMRCKHIFSFILFLMVFVPFPAAAQAQQWVQLGCKDVDLNLDRDALPVGARDGAFRAIRLRARGNAVQMFDLKVVYGNGERDDIPVRARIAEGGSSGALDLRGRERAIERIQMIYARVTNWRGRARICVDGRPG